MIVRLFNPDGIDPRSYKTTYQELAETPEFTTFSGKQLIFIWYYANPTSPIIDIKDNKERAEQALKISQYTPERSRKERILSLNFDDDMEKAIDAMGSYEPGARYISWMLVKKVFEEYTEMVNDGKEAFTIKKFDSEGAEVGEVFDHRGYVGATKDIVLQLPILIDKLEKGFGISVVKKGESDEDLEGAEMIRMWNQSKND